MRTEVSMVEKDEEEEEEVKPQDTLRDEKEELTTDTKNDETNEKVWGYKKKKGPAIIPPVTTRPAVPVVLTIGG